MGTQSAEWITASRLLRRSGFGTTGAAIDKALAAESLESVVETMMMTGSTKDAGVGASPMPGMELLRHPGYDAPEDQRAGYYKERSRQMRNLSNWWVRRMVVADNPAREKLTFLWHNHFATSGGKVINAVLMGAQNEKIRKLCLGDFEDLGYAMLTDAAMIEWLDAKDSIAAAPNENLAREFLELFAVGHGSGYTEADVKEGARALTGWQIGSNGKAKFAEDRHDGDAKTVLGSTGDFDARQFCSIVVRSPESPRFIARRLWQQLAADEPPSQQLVDRLVAAYSSERDLRALTTAILTEPEFLEGRGTVVSGPVDWLIGTLRAFQVPVEDPKRVAEFSAALKALGQLPFYPPDVGGWPRGRSWLSTGSVSRRFDTAVKAVGQGDISLVEDAPASERLDAVGYLIGVGHWTGSTAAALKPLVKDPPRLAAAAVNSPEYLTA